MQQETVKLLIVKTDPSLPASVGVSMMDLRDAVLNHPEVVIDALRGLTGASSPPTGGTQPPPVGDLPMDTPIFKMLDADKATLLTANAKRLTKADLLALRGEGVPLKTPAQLNLSVEDIKSVEEAFHQQFAQDIVAGGSSGLAKASDITLCCCPCCTCTAAVAIQPVQRVA